MDQGIVYDIIRNGRVVDMFRATSPSEALEKYNSALLFVGYSKLKEGLYGYSMPGVGMGSTVARPSFSPS